jgi:hypothetical protein
VCEGADDRKSKRNLKPGLRSCTAIMHNCKTATPRTVPAPRSWSSRPAGSRVGGRVPAGSACPASAHWQFGHSASTAPGHADATHTQTCTKT